jgi:hypothetical protein
MATMINRGRRQIDRWSSAVPILPAALIALVGDEAVNRTMEQARGWLKDQQLPNRIAPIRRVMQRELRKGKKLEGVMPFFPVLPILPVALVAGLATFSTVLALRGRRKDHDMTARLDALEAELVRVKEQRKEQHTAESQPVMQPWS